MSQTVREKSLAKFRAGKAQVIVCTDVAARGIDVENVTHVINYDCPDDEKTYVHRIGRTGRAGRTGIAVTFVVWADIPRWKVINRALDLDFPEPIEAYSTTSQLLEELGIPEGATGRMATPAAKTDTTSVKKAHHQGEPPKPAERNPGRRQRRRHGVVIREKAPPTSDQSDGKPVGEDGTKRRRRRRVRKPE